MLELGDAPLAIAVSAGGKGSSFRDSEALVSKKHFASLAVNVSCGVRLGGRGGSVGGPLTETFRWAEGGGVGRVVNLKDPDVLGRPPMLLPNCDGGSGIGVPGFLYGCSTLSKILP